MNKDDAKDFLPLVKALADGKTIQYRTSLGEWHAVTTPAFHTRPDMYRIKPEPQVLWVLFDSYNRLRGTFHEKAEAVKYSGYVEGYRIVKFVESKD